MAKSSPTKKKSAPKKKKASSKQICKHEGCTNGVVNSGVCYRHGAKKRLCKHQGCTNVVKTDGVCLKHGARSMRQICSVEGCTKFVQSKGVCWKHGGAKCKVANKSEGSDKVVAQAKKSGDSATGLKSDEGIGDISNVEGNGSSNVEEEGVEMANQKVPPISPIQVLGV